jgi:hypothetical protein
MLNNSSSPDRLKSVLFQRHTKAPGDLSPELKNFIVEAMKQNGSFQYVEKILMHIHGDLMDLVEGIESELGWNAQLKLLVLASSL